METNLVTRRLIECCNKGLSVGPDQKDKVLSVDATRPNITDAVLYSPDGTGTTIRIIEVTKDGEPQPRYRVGAPSLNPDIYTTYLEPQLWRILFGAELVYN